MIKKDFLFLGVGRVFQALIALLSLRLMTTFLPQDEVGYSYLILAVCGYFGLVFINPLGMYFNRHIHELEKSGGIKSAFKSMNIYFALVALISLPIVFFLQRNLGVGRDIPYPELAALVAITIYGTTWFQTLCPSLNMLGKRTHFILINNLAALLGLAFSIGGVFLIKKTAFIWMMGLVSGQIVAAIIAYYYFSIFFLSHNSAGQGRQFFFRKNVLLFCLPVAAATLLLWLQTQSYRLVVENLMSASALAILGVGLGIAASLCALTESVVNQYYYPQYYSVMSSTSAADRARAWRSFFESSLTIHILVTATFIACARPILNILVDKAYHHLAHILALGLVAELFRVLTNAVYTVSHSELKTKSSILPYGLGGILAFFGSIVIAAYYQDSFEVTLPLVLIASSIICFIAMFYSMNLLLPLQVNVIRTVQIVLTSLPLVFTYFLTTEISSPLLSIASCLFAALYTVGALYVLTPKLSTE